MDWQDAEWADGREAAKWMRRNFTNIDVIAPSLARAIRRWETGENPKVDTLDRYLTLFGCHISQLPDEIWLADNSNKRGWGNAKKQT